MKTLIKNFLIGFCILSLGYLGYNMVKDWRTSNQDKGVSKSYSENDNEAPSLLSIISGLGIQKEKLTILIDKSDYELSVLHNAEVIKTYPVVFGTNPIDDKLIQGDRSTPEGSFSIRAFYPHKSWSKFIWIDYPTANSWKKHNKAKAEGIIPKDAKIGGEIGIHGVPKGNSSLISEKQNWTWGCISLTNTDINDLYTIAYEGMKIEIRK